MLVASFLSFPFFSLFCFAPLRLRVTSSSDFPLLIGRKQERAKSLTCSAAATYNEPLAFVVPAVRPLTAWCGFPSLRV